MWMISASSTLHAHGGTREQAESPSRPLWFSPHSLAPPQPHLRCVYRFLISSKDKWSTPTEKVLMTLRLAPVVQKTQCLRAIPGTPTYYFLDEGESCQLCPSYEAQHPLPPTEAQGVYRLNHSTPGVSQDGHSCLPVALGLLYTKGLLMDTPKAAAGM